MPHFIIAHTDNVRPHDNANHVFKSLFDIAAAHPTMDRNAMKGRIQKLDATYTVDGDAARSYVHLELAILSGRETSLKQDIGKALLAALPTFFNAPDQCQFSVEIRDMDRDAYFKQTQ